MMAERESEWYRKERERVRKWRAARSTSGRDIGRLPPVADVERKSLCARSLVDFYRTYFPRTFDKPFCGDHYRVIDRIEQAVMFGGLFALAMPRGAGKTSFSELAALWAVLYGYHRFVALFGATVLGAQKMLESIKLELRTNELLLADFPESCYPIWCLEGISNRSSGQLYHGQPTMMRATSKQLVLPRIPGSPASQAILSVDGIGSENIRGKHVKTPDGETIRPSLAVLDDPQTDRSARSSESCQKIEDTISGAVIGMAGPGKKIAAIMPCTVIHPHDLADRLLDRALHPEWNGIRTKTLYSFPARDDLWQRYSEIRADSMRAGNHGAEATEFYRQHRAEMDEGSEVAWPERYRDDELSALQSAMNRYYRDRYAFFAEDQNEPLDRTSSSEIKLLTAAEIMQKMNRVPLGQVPAECATLTAFVDIGQDVLWWLIAGWSPVFGGAVIDYGTWPEQQRQYVTTRDLRIRIEQALPDLKSLEARIYGAVEAAVEELASRELLRVDGTQLRIARVLVDAGWQTETIYRFCRQSSHAAILTPSHGHGVRATQTPISGWARQTGERRGPEWVIRRSATDRSVRHVTFNTNHWKSFVHSRLASGMGDPSSLSLCGQVASDHRMIADHWLSETPVRVTAKGRTVDEWSQPPGADNHLLDCIVGASVAASIEGCVLVEKSGVVETAPRTRRKRPRVSYLT